MKKLLNYCLVVLFFLLPLSIARAELINGFPAPDTSTTFVGPYLSGVWAAPLPMNTAWSLLGEAGPSNLRLNGTFGWQLSRYQRAKVSAEYLWQNIRYNFFSGSTRQWVNQGAVGLTYEQDLRFNFFNPMLAVTGYYSHAPSKSLHSRMVTFEGFPGPSIEMRRIAGSNASGISPGFILQLLQGTMLGLYYNFDNVRYDTIYRKNQDAVGSGGTITLDQWITPDLTAGVVAGIRQPFNLYQANVNWFYFGDRNLSFGLDAAYVAGKTALPSTWNIGVTVNYSMEAPLSSGNSLPHVNHQGLVNWTSKPAVRMPQVLAIADFALMHPATVCTPPLVIGIVPDTALPDTGLPSSTPISTASAFSGENLSYSVSPATYPDPENLNISVDQAGVVTVVHTIDGGSFQVPITVTATNACGTASLTFFVSYSAAVT